MKVFLYRGGLSIVEKSGIGQAIHHQEDMLRKNSNLIAPSFRQADIVVLNTIFPDSLFVGLLAKIEGKKVIYYGHSTMEDFRNSFIGSNQIAPLFKLWLKLCYGIANVIVTPSHYSKKVLESYGFRNPVVTISNGVDTEFFFADKEAGNRFRKRYQIPIDKKVVISAGHLIHRKGIMDFLEVAKRHDNVQFIWFGGNPSLAIPEDIKKAIASKPDNVIFAGFVKPDQLREAYCGSDAFAFFSHEETQGIVVLEALACQVPVLVRDIPVYEDWLEDGKHVLKARDIDEFDQKINCILKKDTQELQIEGLKIAQEHSLENVYMDLMQVYDQVQRIPLKV